MYRRITYFSKYKKIIDVLVWCFGCLPKFVLVALYSFVQPFSGKIGILFRYVIVKNLCACIGDNVVIGQYVIIKSLHKLSIGSNVSIHAFCYIDAEGGLKIGNNVSIATKCTILSTDHTWSDRSIPIKYNQVIKRRTIIGDDVWFGAGCTVCAGADVQPRVIVGAHSLVKGRLEKSTVYAGTPAKIMKVLK
jgi:acetyltransferase-like isoleucine patch superfamily enzyme